MQARFNRNTFPKLYPIVDAGLLAARSWNVAAFAAELRAAGVQMLQYRNKQGSEQQLLQDTAAIRAIFSGTTTHLILNDRPDLLQQSGFHGVHVGQQDMAPGAARAITGPQALVGVSTHTLEQMAAADATDCDYIAYGPVFATASKANPDPVVGMEGLRAARRVTSKPLVAIGGITRQNCRAVMAAGADSIAVISELFPREGQSGATTVRQIAEEFLALLA